MKTKCQINFNLKVHNKVSNFCRIYVNPISEVFGSEQTSRTFCENSLCLIPTYIAHQPRHTFVWHEHHNLSDIEMDNTCSLIYLEISSNVLPIFHISPQMVWEKFSFSGQVFLLKWLQIWMYHICNFSFSEAKSRSWCLKMVLIHSGCTIVHNTSMALNSFEVFDWKIGNFDPVKKPDRPD